MKFNDNVIAFLRSKDNEPAQPPATTNTEATPGLRFIGDRPSVLPGWLVKQMLPVRGVALLSGQFSSGKSFVASDLALSVIYGSPFLERKVKAGGVLWFAAEGSDEIELRIKAARCKFEDKTGANLPLFWPERMSDGDTNAVLVDIKRTIEQAKTECAVRYDGLPLRLVVVDTLAAALSIEDENSNAEAGRIMRKLGDIAKRLDVLILVVAHLGKNAEAGTRGASAYGAGAESIITVLADIDQRHGELIGKREIALPKVRRSKTGKLATFDLVEVIVGRDEDGDPVSSCYVDFGPVAVPEKRGPKLGTAEQKLFDSIIEVMSTDNATRESVLNDSPPIKVAPIDLVRDEFKRRYFDSEGEAKPDTVKKAFGRALESLERKELIVTRHIETGGFVWPIAA